MSDDCLVWLATWALCMWSRFGTLGFKDGDESQFMKFFGPACHCSHDDLRLKFSMSFWLSAYQNSIASTVFDKSLAS